MFSQEKMRAAIPARLECCSEKLSHSAPSCAPYTLQLWVATLLSLHPDKSAFVSLGSSHSCYCFTYPTSLTCRMSSEGGSWLIIYQDIGRIGSWVWLILKIKFGFFAAWVFWCFFVGFFLPQIYFSNYKLVALHLGITFSWLWVRNIVGRILGNGQKLV